jgi:hypothetical protein
MEAPPGDLFYLTTLLRLFMNVMGTFIHHLVCVKLSVCLDTGGRKKIARRRRTSSYLWSDAIKQGEMPGYGHKRQAKCELAAVFLKDLCWASQTGQELFLLLRPPAYRIVLKTRRSAWSGNGSRWF